ncbi:PepSY domain-containing protein [Phyllobacterium sp. 21LDTY02-6]|uniref:PepSY domain-containing protein n=1 Tax=Phyllobacterium sp. 21LDTY02-6 TaxID=2944903 RepID=UPI00202063FA|nr:PepSY domain-containing protein [Phyllobacterium sp. 21LDTY02-6]MCO4317229.1 PepSY domain-containing protein [Phyllobacterium sp. 21LDTY02-6]
MLRKLVIAGAAAVLSLTAVPQTFAQSVEIGPGGVRLVEPDRRDRMSRRDEISERQAVRIARAEGVRMVDDVRRTRSRYIVEGMDRRGRDIEVSIDRRSGDVLSVD